ncbi:phage head-binding domain-containing protein [Citrobacter freundii]|uniref:phage head-binding domain-containing protein n=1 Tax=Citrobacter freundii TaxID=546 RepID=UPI001FFDF9C4|nr:phage head-binding domain-containing protein [Citrobacter freundii]
MSDIIPNVVVSQPAQLFTLARSFKANANGKVYIGKIDTDPVNPANQIQVYIDPEDGSDPIPVSQPIVINSGGYPVYNGQISKFVTVQGHSMAVYDAYGLQQFYYPNVLKYDPDQLRVELAGPNGAEEVGYGEKTVGDLLNDIESPYGFDVVGRILNLTELRETIPKSVGDVVYVVSAASTSIEDIHYGGGHFQAVRKQSLVDDGGVTIVPSSGTLVWVRINRSEPCLTWFGVRPNLDIDNQPSIDLATNYGKLNKVTLKAPDGVIEYSKGIPVYSRSGIRGAGKDRTFFDKRTNDSFIVGDSVGFDAFALSIPDVYDPDGTAGDSYCILTELSGATFRRKGIIDRDNAVDYSFWAQKMAVSIVRDLRFECGNFGFWGENVWSNIIESVQFLGLGIGQYCGFQISKYKSATGYALSGTSNVMNMVQVANYQFGFIIDSHQYTTMTCCTADSIFPMTGTSETLAAAYAFYNPFGITMNSCGAEGVRGSQILIRTANYMDFDASITINSFMGCIEQKNPLVATQVFRIENTVGKFLSVVFNAGNILADSSLSNLSAGFIAGENTYVRTVITRLDPPTISGGADYKVL